MDIITLDLRHQREKNHIRVKLVHSPIFTKKIQKGSLKIETGGTLLEFPKNSMGAYCILGVDTPSVRTFVIKFLIQF